MVHRCAVANCKNTVNTKRKEKSDLIFHSFPIRNKAICKVWVDKCRRMDKINIKSASICSVHFDKDSYVRDLQHELLGLPPRRKLNANAVPSLFDSIEKGIEMSARSFRVERRERKDIIDSLLQVHANENVTPETAPLKEPTMVFTQNDEISHPPVISDISRPVNRKLEERVQKISPAAIMELTAVKMEESWNEVNIKFESEDLPSDESDSNSAIPDHVTDTSTIASSYAVTSRQNRKPNPWCTLCPIPTLFENRLALHTHILRHAVREKNYIPSSSRKPQSSTVCCSVCSKKFYKGTKRAAIKRHLETHLFPIYPPHDPTEVKMEPSELPNNQDKPPVAETIICSICLQEFRWKGFFTRHLGTCKLKRDYKLAQERKAAERERLAQQKSDTSDSEEENPEANDRTEKISNCPVCPSTFNTPADLTTHLEMDHMINRGIWLCPVCKRSFKTSPKSLRSHLKIHAGEAPYICPVCKKAFVKYSDFQKHVDIIHKPSWKYKCIYCPRSFSMKAEVEVHSEHFHGKQVYPCTVVDCQQSLESLIDLEQHKLQHVKLRLCTECDEIFGDKNNYKLHKKIHKAKNPLFKCEQCDMKFNQHTVYTTHLKQPHDFKCIECPTMFHSRSQARNHYSRNHWITKPFYCPSCKGPFNSLDSLFNHVEICRGK